MARLRQWTTRRRWLAGLLFMTALGIILLAVFNASAPSLAVGMPVRVVKVGEQELNIRSQPGLADSQILFRAAAGAKFQIIGGPHDADGFAWWHVQDAVFQLDGWAVADYLQADKAETGQSP